VTTRQLSSLDLSYARPSDPVWNPTFTAANVPDGTLE
jgi:hypothetical protein